MDLLGKLNVESEITTKNDLSNFAHQNNGNNNLETSRVNASKYSSAQEIFEHDESM